MSKLENLGHRVKIIIRERDRSEPYMWCLKNFGPRKAEPYDKWYRHEIFYTVDTNPDLQVPLLKGTLAYNYYFTYLEDAMLFKMRWL